MEKDKRANTTRDSDKYIVRMPEGMRDRIAAAAKLNGRTMNAEIVQRLEKSFEPAPPAREVAWDLRVEQRTIDIRKETLQSHLLVVKMYLETLDAKLQNAIATGVSQEEIQKIRDEREGCTADEKHLQAQVQELATQSRDVDLRFEVAAYPIDIQLDRASSESLQPEFEKILATEIKIGVPARKRTLVR
jgi:hypothetical protein